jgi:predicted glycogen debranching enzyme
MSYLKFDKTLLTNLQKSLRKEMLRTNKSGAYSATTINDCNTRKYHGLLVVPVPELDDDNHVLLSSLDETVIQHGAEFNLGLHKYEGDNYSPNGHKYIREFSIESVARTTYRVGGVILSKERVFVSHENRILIKYTLLDAHSCTTLRLRPFLAFRSVSDLCIANDIADTDHTEVQNGIAMCLYEGYPTLYMQFSKTNKFVTSPDWYRGIEYPKEQERGYNFKEDLLVPGYFELSISKGESVIFSAGTSSIDTDGLASLYMIELEKRTARSSFYNSLKNAAQQFYLKRNGDYYLLAGYPWFKSRARDEFIALTGTTLAIDDTVTFEKIMATALVAVNNFLQHKPIEKMLYELDAPDVLLWFIRAVQYYAKATSIQQAYQLYGKTVLDIISFIRKQGHPNLFLHENGLLYTNGKQKAATWMNAMENGYPITPRTGYVVEINALWYNALKFASELSISQQDEYNADLSDYQSEMTRQSFTQIFWNGTYLYDYVDGDYKDWEVRPNMILAVALPYSPLEKTQQKSIVDITTRELLTPKGLRTLSPKSQFYRPSYVGGQLDRDRNYHNGPVWPWLTSSFAEAYLKIYKRSGVSFIERMLIGFESEMSELCISTLSELHDGNPPFTGHGAMSFAMSVSAILRTLKLLQTETAN